MCGSKKGKEECGIFFGMVSFGCSDVKPSAGRFPEYRVQIFSFLVLSY